MHGVQPRTGKTYQVAVPMTAPTSGETEWEGVEHARLLSGISHAMEDTRCRVALYAVRDYDEAQDTIRQIVRNRQTDGLVFSGTRPDDARVRLLQEAAFPFVTHGTTSAHAPRAVVDADNEGIIRAAMTRLFERGHRRIALINPPARLSCGQTGLAAYRRMLEEVGLPCDEALAARGRLTPGFGRRQVIGMQLGRLVLQAMAGEAPDKLQTLLMPDLIERSADRPRP